MLIGEASGSPLRLRGRAPQVSSGDGRNSPSAAPPLQTPALDLPTLVTGSSAAPRPTATFKQELFTVHLASRHPTRHNVAVGLHEPPTRPAIALLVTDLDNTLWDWVEIWYQSFSSLLNGIVRISGIPRADLLPEIRTIHRLRGTAEYSYLIGEMPSLRLRHGPDADLQQIYRDAIDAARKARNRALKLYPGVLETLTRIHDAGTIIAGYTESLAFQTQARVKKLGLDGVLDFLYSPPDHDFPVGTSREELRRMEPAAYGLQHTKHLHTAPGQLKPTPEILAGIVDEWADVERTAYVGDSLMKDVPMAQRVGALDVWAEYGVAIQRAEYELLQSVTHWTDADVEREMEIARQPRVTPTFTLHHSFAELLECFEFVANERRRACQTSN